MEVSVRAVDVSVKGVEVSVMGVDKGAPVLRCSFTPSRFISAHRVRSIHVHLHVMA